MTGRRGSYPTVKEAAELAAFKAEQQLSNLRFEFIKRLGYRDPIGKCYVDRRFNVHLHLTSGGKNIVAGVEIGARVEGGDLLPGKGLATGGVDDNEIPMLVSVGEFPKAPRPVDSLARLYRFDQVELPLGHTTEVGGEAFAIGQAPSLAGLEVLAVVVQGELRLTLARDDVDGVVQRGPEVVDGLSDPDSKITLGGVSWRDIDGYLSALQLTVGGEHDLSLRANLSDQGLDVARMFLCPTMPQPGTAEVVRHAANCRVSARKSADDSCERTVRPT